MLKRITLVTLTIGLVASVGLAATWMTQAAGPPAVEAAEQASGLDTAQTITVVGHGSVSASPDIARVTVGVETSAETVSEAVAENASHMKAILAVLEGLGIARKDIRTMNYSVHMDRSPEPYMRGPVTETEQVGPEYRVSNMANVIIRDLDRVSEVLDGVVEAGANSIWGVTFELEDQEEVEADARSEAVDDALARAQTLAELSQVELGPVMSVSEVVGMFTKGTTMSSLTPIVPMGGGGTPVNRGEVEVGYEVQVTYFIARQ
jgi:uncharacterized protein YggE